MLFRSFNLGQFVSRFFDIKPEKPAELRLPDRWILSRYSDMVARTSAFFDEYQFDKAMKEIESFIWHEFADHYVEMVKSRKDDAVRYTLYTVFLGSLKIIAPFLPHVTEDVYQSCFVKHEGTISLHLTSWPEPVLKDDEAAVAGDVLKDIIAAIRGWKSEKIGRASCRERV